MILWRAALRYLLRHPLQLLFAVIGVALGVGVVVAIDLANSSANKAFNLSAEAVSGRTSHQVVGGPDGLPEEVYRQIRLAPTTFESAPVVEGLAAVPHKPGLTLRILGLDPFAEGPFREYSPGIGGNSDFIRLLTDPGSIMLSAATARDLDLRPDMQLTLQIGGKNRSVTLVGLLQAPDQLSSQALQNLIITDIATAQELLEQFGRLTRIDLILPSGASEETALQQLHSYLPAGVDVVRADQRQQSMAQMTRAFQLNLTALSMLALVVGMFLIYNTMTFSVVQRRPLLGALRTLGVTRREIIRLVLVEALLVGAVGTLLGLALGVLLANGLLALVTRTINDLYFVLNVRSLTLTPLPLAKGLLLGLGATLVAALVPALEAGRTAPRSVLSRSHIEGRGRRLLPWAVAAGSGLMVLSLVGLLLPGHSIIVGFICMFMLISGYALITPGLAVWLLKGLQSPFKTCFGILGKMAVRNLVAGLSRTGVATAALVIAVAATIGVGLMISSFRVTVDNWLHSYLSADIYITTQGNDFGAGRVPLEPELLERLGQVAGIEKITRARHLRLEDAHGISELFVAEIPESSFAGYWFADGDRQQIYREFNNTRAVIVSEPFAYRRDLKRGDFLTLRTQRGEKKFRIAGVFTDYGSDQGRITIARSLYQQYWSDPQTDALGMYLKDTADTDLLVRQLRGLAADMQQLMVYSNRDLREASLATFDRTFAVTSVLRILAVLVAFVGILNALMAMQIERSRELAVLRAGGLTPQQLWLLVTGETGLIGLLAGLLALPLGIAQALILILVINRRSFGWSMDIQVDSAILFQALLLALIAAVLAGLYPAWRMAQTQPAQALRDE